MFQLVIKGVTNMDTNVWIDFERIMVFIRFNITRNENIEIIDIIKKFFDGNISKQEMLIQIIHIMPEWENQLILEEGNNYQDNYLECSFIRQSLSCVKDYLLKSEFNVAYDIVDMLHAFPGVILNGDKGEKERFKETYLKPLVRKWNLTLKL